MKIKLRLRFPPKPSTLWLCGLIGCLFSLKQNNLEAFWLFFIAAVLAGLCVPVGKST